jgi:hypothetical protein
MILPEKTLDYYYSLKFPQNFLRLGKPIIRPHLLEYSLGFLLLYHALFSSRFQRGHPEKQVSLFVSLRGHTLL